MILHISYIYIISFVVIMVCFVVRSMMIVIIVNIGMFIALIFNIGYYNFTRFSIQYLFISILNK